VHHYYIILFLNVLNVLLGIAIFLIIPVDFIPFYFEIGVLSYFLISSSYFGLFGGFLSKSLRNSFCSILIHRKYTLVFFIPILLFFSFKGSLSITHLFLFIFIFFMWIVSPYELILRKTKTNQQEVRVELIKQIVLIFTKSIIILFPSKLTLILSVFNLYLFHFLASLLILRRQNIKLWVYFGFRAKIDHINTDKLYGYLFSILVYFLVQFDYFYLSYIDSTKLEITAVGHKIEEYVVLFLGVFSPWFHRKILADRFSVIQLLGFSLLFFSLLSIAFYSFIYFYDVLSFSNTFPSDALSLMLQESNFINLFLFSGVLFIFSDIVYTRVCFDSKFSIRNVILFCIFLLVAYILSILVFSDLGVQFIRIVAALILCAFYIYLYSNYTKNGA